MQLIQKTAVLGYIAVTKLILLLFKKFVYDSRATACVILNTFIQKLTKTREIIKKTIAVTNKNKLKRYNVK